MITGVLLILSINLSGQIQDTLYVFTESGLWLREKPSFDSEKIRLLPSGTRITNVVEYTDSYSSSGWITDRWVKVNIGDTLGFLFKGYLSSFRYPKLYNGYVGYDGTELSYLLKAYLDSQLY